MFEAIFTSRCFFRRSLVWLAVVMLVASGGAYTHTLEIDHEHSIPEAVNLALGGDHNHADAVSDDNGMQFAAHSTLHCGADILAAVSEDSLRTMPEPADLCVGPADNLRASPPSREPPPPKKFSLQG
jgi:hypothetical protein